MSKDNLYEISNQLAIINDELISNEGEISDLLERRLDDCGLAFNHKVEGIVRWTRNIEGKEAALDAEIARLQKRKKVAGNLKERLKSYMMQCMVIADKTKVEFDLCTVAIQKNPPSCDIVDPEAVPEKYITIKEVKVIDKKSILDDLKAGAKVEGAVLVKDKCHLRIR